VHQLGQGSEMRRLRLQRTAEKEIEPKTWSSAADIRSVLALDARKSYKYDPDVIQLRIRDRQP